MKLILEKSSILAKASGIMNRKNVPTHVGNGKISKTLPKADAVGYSSDDKASIMKSQFNKYTKKENLQEVSAMAVKGAGLGLGGATALYAGSKVKGALDTTFNKLNKRNSDYEDTLDQLQG